MPPLLFLVLWNGQQRIHILLDGIVFLCFGSCGFELRKEPFLFCVEISKLRFHAFSCRQRHSPQPFQFSGGRFKKDDFALMPPQKLFLIAGFTVTVVDRFQLAIGGSVLHHKGKFGTSAFYSLDLRMSGIPALRHGGQLAFQFSIAAYPVFGQEIHGLGGLFQIVQLRPMGEACALLCLNVILDINEQADLPVLLFQLAGRSGASSNPGGKGFFGVIHTKGFQTGEPFLIRCFGGDILAALNLITFSLQAAKQFF